MRRDANSGNMTRGVTHLGGSLSQAPWEMQGIVFYQMAVCAVINCLSRMKAIYCRL